MRRTLVLIYGILAYVIFLAAFLYAIAFVGDFAVPRTIDRGLTQGIASAIAIDVALLLLFAAQHSIMARPRFKAWWTRIVPQPAERSTYVLATSLVLAFLYWQWRPVLWVIWDIPGSVYRNLILAVFGLGWGLVLVSTFLIDHFDLFGLRQVWLNFRQREYTPIAFKMTGLYRYVRHPIMLGFIVAFWAAPTMTAGHLLFAVVTTGYIVIAIRIEEADLLRFYGENYRRYRDKVRALLPLRRR